MKRLLLSMFVMFLYVGPASAAVNYKDMYKKLDTDGNGYLSLDEVKGKNRIFYYYDEADKNRDGQISLQEFTQFEKKVPNWVAKKSK